MTTGGLKRDHLIALVAQNERGATAGDGLHVGGGKFAVDLRNEPDVDPRASDQGRSSGFGRIRTVYDAAKGRFTGLLVQI